MTTGQRTRQQGGNRRGGQAGGFGRRRRGRNFLKREEIDYKDVQLMRRFVSERGKLVSGQRLGVTAKNQRRLARAIKRAQHLALVPMAPNHNYVTGSIQTDTPQRSESSESESAPPENAAPESTAPEGAAPESAEQNETPEEQSDDTPEAVEQSADAQTETPEEPAEQTPEQS